MSIIDTVQPLLAKDEDGLQSLNQLVVQQAKISPETTMQDLIQYLECFEKIGVKKVPERLEILNEMKERILRDQSEVYNFTPCDINDLLLVIETYPKTLKNKVS